MATIQDRLNILASTTEAAQDARGLTREELEEEKKKASVIDYTMVSFSLAGKDYAIDIMKVKEIAKAGHFTYVPNTLPFVLGVYNLRGEIIPIIDLRLFFNIQVEEHDENYLENMLIVTVGEQTFGVVVDAIDKVVGIQKAAIQPPHPLFGDINIKYINGVVEAQHHLYVLLDIDKIFGVRTPEEEKELAETAQAQLEQRQAIAAEVAAQQQAQAQAASASVASSTKPAKAAPAAAKSAPSTQNKAAEAEKQQSVDLNFIADSLQNLKKFTLNAINEEWARNRYDEWKKERGNAGTQIQNESDADSFLKTFWSPFTGTWWSEQYATDVSKALPENSAKNIVVWNPGCGKGFESYSLACLLKKRYPNAHIRIYGHDIDLLSVSNAPLMNVPDNVSSDWYQPYVTRTVTGDWTFNKEIKDMIMFEYHDCVNTNNLPPIDIVFARDIISFLPEASQKSMLNDFAEKVKGNGVIIIGENERIALSGWTRKKSASVAIYSK